jgi:pimeloyl-ACP methyl ester carboxylesterase
MFTILYLLIVSFMKRGVIHRWDGSPAFPYWSAKALGVEEEGFSFLSGRWRLYGSRYYVGNGPYKALVVFFHGIGAGRNAYIQLICDLAKQGYLVYAFDNTGSMQSEGPLIYGLGQIVRDEKAFYSWLDQDEKAQGLDRYSVGHSWGGYAALVSGMPEYQVKKIVSISGFNSVGDEFRYSPETPHNKVVIALYRFYLWNTLGKEGNLSACKVLQSSSAQVLYIQGEKDQVVTPEAGMLALKRGLSSNPRMHYLTVKGQGHICFMSPESEKYINDLNSKGLAAPNGPIGLAMDLGEASKENDFVMQSIFDFLAH